MATSRLVLLFVCLSAPALRAADDCVCDDYTEEEKNEIWEFFKKYPNGVDNEGVLPAVLSPLERCSNCIEYDRKKRTILPSPTEDVQKSVQPDRSEDTDSIEQDPRCPVGFARIGFRCVHLDDVF